MRKKSLICKIKDKVFLSQGLFLLGLVLSTGALFTSCDDVYDDDASFRSDVTNQTLTSPDVDKIVVTPSTDGTSQTISWPVVHGAKGYEVSFYDMSDPENPAVLDEMKNKNIDGCSVTVSREEDMNYRFTVKALGNEALNNKDAETATEVAFNTFTETFATIPSGADLYEWFQSNPIPEDKVGEMLCFDLEPDGEYTLSQSLNFFNKLVTLRTSSKTNHAKVTIANEARIKTATGITMKYIDFDCSATFKPVIEMSDELDESIKGVISGSQAYYDVQENIVLNSCNFEGVNDKLFFDGDVKYCIGVMLIKNCIVHLTSSSLTSINGDAIIRCKSGFINSLTVSESTFWNTGGSDAKYFVQYNNSCRCDRGGYTRNSVSFTNNTFYNVAKAGQWGNYSGFAGRGTSDWVMTNNIFVDCGSNQITRRFLAGRQNQATAVFANNTYMFDGGYENTAGYDNSGTNIEEDPQFADPANGNFTISGAAQLEKKTGDPRWLPEAE